MQPSESQFPSLEMETITSTCWYEDWRDGSQSTQHMPTMWAEVAMTVIILVTKFDVYF